MNYPMRACLPFLAISAALCACAASGDPDAADGPDAPDTEGDSEGETEGETTGPDGEDPLAQCRELPAAASLVEGEATVSSAASTPERILAAGTQTWPLALELLRVVGAETAPSVAASPASMYVAMGLSYGRWQSGQCGDRIAEVMAFPEAGDDLHHTLGASVAALESRALEATAELDPVVLSLRQSTWEFGVESLPEAEGLAEIYGARRYALPQPDADARDLINCVIEQQSQGLLPEFLPEGQPAADTASYDINVAYLQAPWDTGMNERPLSFTFADGSTDIVDGFGYGLLSATVYDGETFTAAQVPLRGGALQMLVVLPNDESGLSVHDLAASLDAETLATARAEAGYEVIDFTMPKLKIEGQTLDYNAAGRLEFMCEPFTLRSVFHGAAVEMDEKGIKAAAATVNEGWNDGGEPEPTRVLTIDRPFLFFVYDDATQFVLYSGRWAPESA
jgi:serine protease inhibitor